MKLHPRLTSASVELVMRFEGLRRRAARLPGGGWTIGYGHTASARQGAVVTAVEAKALLTYDLSRVASEIDALVFTPLNRNQFDALVSFAFNIGVANFRGSAVLKRINEGRLLQAAAGIELWRKAAFEGEDLVLDALVRRRAAEKALFLTPPEGFRPAPTPVLPPQVDDAGDEASAEPAVVDAGLDGETATVERAALELFPDHAPLPATRAAAANVSAKLQELIPDSEEVEEPAAPPPMELLWEAPDAQGEPAPATAAPPAAPVITPYTPPPPHPAFEPPAPANEAAPVEEPPSAAPPPFPPVERAAEFGRRVQDVDSETPPAAKDAPPSPPDVRRMKLYLGALGVAMFGGAILSMFQDKATILNLFIGLAGIMCMTPAAVILLTPNDES